MKSGYTTPRIIRLATPLILAASLAACSSMGNKAATNDKEMSPPMGKMAMPGMGANMASSKVSAADQQFINEIAYANLGEIFSGQLALKKSQDMKVRGFAQRMIDDHTRAYKQLQTLGQSVGATVPTETDLKNKATAMELNVLSGMQFDSQYMAQAGVAAHQRTHDSLVNVQRNANDPALRSYAGMILPVVDSHLSEAQTMTGM